MWHEYSDKIRDIATKYDLKIIKLHIHIGSENTPESWKGSAQVGLDMIEKFPDVVTFDMG